MAGAVCVRSYCGLFGRQGLFLGRFAPPMNGVKTKVTVEVPPKPKQPPTIYIAYFNEVRKDLVRENPGLKISEYAKLAGQRWHLLSQEQKDSYKPTDKSVEVYKTALNEWKENLTEEQLSSIKEKADRKRQILFKKRVQSLGKPERPGLSGFTYYVKSMPIPRGDAPITMYIQGLSQQWNKMAVEDKESYILEAKRKGSEYFVKLDAWEQEMIEAGNFDVVRKSSLPSNIDKKTLKPKVPKKKKAVKKRATSKKASKKKAVKKRASSKKASKSGEKKSTKKSKAVDEDVSWMKEE